MRRRAPAVSDSNSNSYANRPHCGSFAVNGHYGAANDYLLLTFIECCDGPLYPDAISVGADVGEWLADVWRKSGEWMSDTKGCELPPRRPEFYRGARIAYGDAPLGVVRFYRNRVLVGECSGWTV